MIKAVENCTRNIQVDIAVVGGGAAGLAAALTASERAVKSIVVLEARSTTGGNSAFAEGFFAINPECKNRVDIQNIKDQIFEDAINYAHHRIDQKLLRKLIDEAEKTFRWLEEKGLNFEWRSAPHNSGLPLYASEIKAKSKTGAAVIKILTRACHDNGISVLCNTRARRLIFDKHGEISGVQAETDGENIRIFARCVVIASGGFAGNKKLLKKYIPSFSDDIFLGGVPNQGDGVTMAAEVGVNSDDGIVLEMEGPSFAGTRQISVYLTANPATVWVNSRGERFTEEQFEPFECANILNRQPGKVSYTLFDNTIKKRIFKEEFEQMGTASGMKLSPEIRLEGLFKVHEAKGRIKTADSWDEIANWIGAPAAVLKATIKEYNTFCDRKYDALFNKKPEYLLPLRRPPYTAIRCYPNLLVTHGGIKVNANMEALDRNDKPVPGLFAAGIDTGGVDADTYNFGIPGHSFGFALSTGRIAGKEAADYFISR